MEQNEQNMTWALIRMQELECLPGFPRTEPGITACARHFLKIVKGEEVTNANFGTVIDDDWLIDRILSTRDRFPTPVEMREVYKDLACPADECVDVTEKT